MRRATIPEPTTDLLTATGLASLVGARRRKLKL
jgi:PEP-CTERM motif